MDTFELNKKCEICREKIPDSFGNLLCYKCYEGQAKNIEQNKKDEEEAKTQVAEQIGAIDEPSGKAADNLEWVGPGGQENALTKEINSSVETSIPVDGSIPSPSAFNVNGITDSNYQENPEMEDKDQVLANWAQFQRSGVFLWNTTRTMYEWIKDYARSKAMSHPQYPKFIWKPKIVDVGCGSGVGSNILSQEADFIWGIDKNKMSINFAQQLFTRVKNNYYYCPQVTFDYMDLTTDERETMKFDFVVAIEIIEHIYDYKKFLTQIINKFDKKDPRSPTEYFISTPNRANKHLGHDKPINTYHVREFTSTEYHNVLQEFFNKIEFFNSAGVPCPFETEHTPILAKCSDPKI